MISLLSILNVIFVRAPHIGERKMPGKEQFTAEMLRRAFVQTGDDRTVQRGQKDIVPAQRM
jgi:hypothetical protein